MKYERRSLKFHWITYMIEIIRKNYLKTIEQAFEVNPVVALLGPRQCGKTTLAKLFAEKHRHQFNIQYLDLENPVDLAKLDEPMITLANENEWVVIDEIQRRPELFPLLRVLIDQHREKRKFLILGSASRDLIKQSSETLAGRISYLELTPFIYGEVNDLDQLWMRGGFPNSYLATDNRISVEWRHAYITTFLERDIPNLGIQVPARTLRRFWMMLAHCHGNIFNASELGQSMGVAHTTIRHYLDILTGTFMVRSLTPWIENLGKRQIKSPKIYFRDSGIFHTLMGIIDKTALLNHPKLGASWEGMALEQVICYCEARPEEVYFWGVHSQGELDLLIFKNGKRLGFEFKYADAPRITKSMQMAQDILKLDELNVIYPGNVDYPLSEKIRVIGLKQYLS